MRAFIAIDLPESLHRALAEQQAAFRAACARGPRGQIKADEIRWTRPEGVHLTLKFLGHISDDQVRQVIGGLKEIGPFERFPVEVKVFGFFPDPRRPRVFWVGVVASPALGQLAKRVEESMENLGFAPENRPFSPHLTLARFKTPEPLPALQAWLEQQGEKTLGRFEASEFFLYESKLSPRGSEYQKVERFPGL